jgi:hypothetical protein
MENLPIWCHTEKSEPFLSTKEGHFILIKGTIQQKEITIINIYAPNVSTPNVIKHTLQDLKAHIDSNTVVVRELIPLYHQ